jgi:ribosome-binding protein aMBF1 (putative translation factor)
VPQGDQPLLALGRSQRLDHRIVVLHVLGRNRGHAAEPLRALPTAGAGVKRVTNEIELRFADRMRKVRDAQRWSAQDVSRRSGLSRVAISKIENGDRGVSLGDAVVLAEALGIPLADMVQPGEFTVQATLVYEIGEG